MRTTIILEMATIGCNKNSKLYPSINLLEAQLQPFAVPAHHLINMNPKYNNYNRSYCTEITHPVYFGLVVTGARKVVAASFF